MFDKKELSFDLAFLMLFAAARAIDDKANVTEDLDQAEQDAHAFMDRLKDVRHAK